MRQDVKKAAEALYNLAKVPTYSGVAAGFLKGLTEGRITVGQSWVLSRVEGAVSANSNHESQKNLEILSSFGVFCDGQDLTENLELEKADFRSKTNQGRS